ncbi:MAG: hypothetical protein WCX46_03445 [Candidatus Paceibacterota bacterium]
MEELLKIKKEIPPENKYNYPDREYTEEDKNRALEAIDVLKNEALIKNAQKRISDFENSKKENLEQ